MTAVLRCRGAVEHLLRLFGSAMGLFAALNAVSDARCRLRQYMYGLLDCGLQSHFGQLLLDGARHAWPCTLPYFERYAVSVSRRCSLQSGLIVDAEAAEWLMRGCVMHGCVFTSRLPSVTQGICCQHDKTTGVVVSSHAARMTYVH